MGYVMNKHERLFHYAETKMKKHGLVNSGWTFRWSKAKKYAGMCDFTKKEISLSKSLAEVRSIKETENTILHEIAHALVGLEHGHGSVWKRKHREIGGDGQQYYKLSDKERRKIKYSYELVHKETGEVYEKYHRKPVKTIDRCARGQIYIRGKRKETPGKLEVRKIQ